MNLALDATYSLGRNLTGVGVYAHELLDGLAAAHSEARFQFCYRPHRWMRSLAVRLPPNARRFLLTETRVPRAADVFHGLNQRLPQARLARTVVTFHDLFVLTGEYSTPEFRRRFAEQARHAAEHADRIIAVSNFTARQVIDLLGVDAAKVRVVHHGVRPATEPRPPAGSEKIILHVGAIQHRKNIARLVDAFAQVDRGWQLVLAGSAGYGAPELLARIAASPAHERIRLLGYVPDAELANWYRRAALFAFPSLDEGFGMPVLEAMAAGVPVLASNRAAIPEVAGEAAWLVDPENSGELTDALVELTRNPQRREELSRHGLRRAAQFSWEEAVKKTWQVYREMAGDQRD